MATIEPRLIHLLNESTTTPRPHNAELPPIKEIYHSTSSRPHPIEPITGPDPLDNGGLLPSQPIPSLYLAADETATTTASSRKDVLGYATADRPFTTHVSSHELRMILDDAPIDNTDDVSTRKRPVKEDFPQLPQPPKKQKPTTTTHMVPPMIVGLLEPPSNAGLFPPISSPSFANRPRSEPPQAPNIANPPDPHSLSEEPIPPSPPPDAERTPTGKVKRRATKPRRKWSEEETNHLLLGVSKHGVGRWTDILEDPGYKFNDRTAGDLKDRFRTCCPEELRNSAGAKGDDLELPTIAKKDRKPRKGLMSENILNATEEEETETDRLWSGQNDLEGLPKQRKSRAHRKKLEDLAELGIRGPFKKSQRRERRPFSEQDDREILEGFEMYGPHWTKIQRDSRFNLSSRQPTDLRDRLRNKYPEKFVSAEKTTMQVREAGGRGNNLLEPSVNTAIESSLNLPKTSLLEPQLNRTGSREDIPKWQALSSTAEFGEPLQPQSTLFWGEGGGGGLSSGEMDISRLLLDDNQILSEPLSTDRRGYG